MTKAYVLVTELIRDPAVYQTYAEGARRTIQQSNGRVLVSDKNPAVVEGQWHGSKTVILEFDSEEAARSWYDSPEYQAIVGLRHASTESNAVILHGIEVRTT
jgi:uncharacterized protein (DUF1330 family)